MKALTLILMTLIFVSCNESGSDSPTVSPKTVAKVATTKYFAYVTNFDDDTIDVKKIDGLSGNLSDVETKNTCDRPNMLAVHPNEKLLYVTCSGDNSIITYSIDQSTGALTELAESTGVGAYPHGIAIEGTGKYLYISNESDAEVAAFTINETDGTLGLVGKYTPGSAPHDVKVIGEFVYVANYSGASNSVSVFSIDMTDGALTKVEDKSAGSGPRILTSYGDFLIAVNQISDNVTIFRRDNATGELTSLGETTVGDSPTSATVMGGVLYVTNSLDDTVGSYTFNYSTGAIALISADPVGDKPIHIIGISAIDKVITINAIDGSLTAFDKTASGGISGETHSAFTGNNPSYGVYVSITN